jgi:hypothetical protein
MCSVGLHLTENPSVWLKSGSCRIFEVEGKDFLLSAEDNLPLHEKDKVVCRSARLIRELTDTECVPFGLLRYGEHTVSSGVFYVSGSATVYASGSVTVEAYNSATVTLEKNSTPTVILKDNAVQIDRRPNGDPILSTRSKRI